MGFLNDGNYRAGTQGRRLRDVGGSMVSGCGSCCDGRSDKSGVTPRETGLLKEKSEQWLWYHVRNTEWIVLYFSSDKIYMSAFMYEVECVVQVCVLYK